MSNGKGKYHHPEFLETPETANSVNGFSAVWYTSIRFNAPHQVHYPLTGFPFPGSLTVYHS